MTCKRTGRRPHKRVRLEVDSLAFGGDAVARDDEGRVVFLPGAVPGDEVEARVVEARKGYARAEVERIVRPSPLRVAPPCPLFEAGCGGCQWQHVAVAGQRGAKAEIVRRELRHFEGEVRPLETPAPEYRWRRRARMRWRQGTLGYSGRRSHRLIDVGACPQLDPVLEGALEAVRASLVPALSGSGELSLLLGGQGHVHLVLEGRGVLGAAQAARGLLSRVRGIVLRDLDQVTVLGDAEIDLGDEPVPFLARADVFAQVSAPGNALLRRLVLEASGPLRGARVLELYAGSGNFTRDLAGAGASVVAVEESPAACALARRNLEARGLSAEVLDQPALHAFQARRRPIDVVVVDPPRTGLEPGLAEAIAACRPLRLVYVSCDPPTLARDLRALHVNLLHATGIDLMPQTFHVEVVAAAEPKRDAAQARSSR
jgi:23S rRNA (uracil1939-C5)-methyltransferase